MPNFIALLLSTKNILKVTTLCCISLFFAACCQKKQYCSTERVKVALVGFNRSESRILSLRRYKQWDYSRAIDSADLTYSGNKPYDPSEPDTLWISEYSSDGLVEDIHHGNDWRLTLPSARQTVLITEINISDRHYEIISCTDNKSSCNNPMINFKVDGTVIDGSVIYIIKSK